jgi:DGQHR domain-containing protein
MNQTIWGYDELKSLVIAFEKMLEEPKNILLHSNLINEHIDNYNHRSSNAIKRRIELINYVYKNDNLSYLQNIKYDEKPGNDISTLIKEIILEIHPNKDIIEIKVTNSIPYTFINVDDFDGFCIYINEKLNNFRDNITKFVEDKDIIFDEYVRLNDFFIELSNNSFVEETNIEEEWDELEVLFSNRYPKQREDIEIYWGEWREKNNLSYEFGYKKDYLKAGIVDFGDNVKRHKYFKTPPDIVWDLVPINQKGKIFYITTAQVCEIEQLSSVPSLPDLISSQETAKRILDIEEGKNQWQRRPQNNRIASITEFANSENNIIANTPMLFVNNTEFVKIENNKAIFNFNFLKEKGYFLVDYEQKSELIDDLRPLWLIDGQHRIRGLSRSETGSELLLPLVLFPNEFGQSNAAKIFAEINTLQTGLKPLHTIFMQYRFSIPSSIKPRDFRPWKSDPNKFTNSRANNLTYELLALLASKKSSPLYNMVNFLEQNITNDKVIKVVNADQWINYTRKWFLSGPYNDIIDNNDIGIIYKEVVSYFTAFIKTCENNDNKISKGWLKEIKKTIPLIQRKTHFQILLSIYPLVRRKLFEKYFDKSIYDENQFYQVLKCLENIDWFDTKLSNTFGGGGEKGRKCLERWIEECIENGTLFEYNEVMTDSIHSERGKGILASPGKCEIVISSTSKFPDKNNILELISYRPYNSMSNATWTVYDDESTDLFGPQKKLSKKDINSEFDISTLSIQFDKSTKKFLDNKTYLKIRVEWFNAVNPNSHCEIELWK